MEPNQIHDVGKLIREAAAAGWDYCPIIGGPLVFSRGREEVQIAPIVSSWSELSEHRRALGLPEHKIAESMT